MLFLMQILFCTELVCLTFVYCNLFRFYIFEGQAQDFFWKFSCLCRFIHVSFIFLKENFLKVTLQNLTVCDTSIQLMSTGSISNTHTRTHLPLK